MQHKFVERNGLLNYEALKGLSSFPIIFARLPVEKILEIAKDPWVFGIDEDVRLKASRAEGGALISSNDLARIGGKGKNISVAVLDTPCFGGVHVVNMSLSTQNIYLCMGKLG